MLGYIKQLFSNSKRLSSSLDVLSKMLSRDALSNVVFHCNDWRLFLDEVAAELRVEPRALAREVARQMKLQFCEEIPSFEPSVIEGIFSLPQCRRLGLVPFVQDETIVGIICADPERVQRLPAELHKIPIYLALWGDISLAIEQLESGTKNESIQREKPAHKPASNKTPSKAVDTVLSLLISEVESFLQKQVEITFAEHGIEYNFLTPELKRARGAINSKVADELRARLNGAALNVLHQKGHAVDIKVIVKSSNCYELSWGALAENKLTQNKLAENKGGESKGAELARANLAEEGIRPALTLVKTEESERVETPQKRPLILILDDNQTFILVLERFFARQGMDVMVYTSTDLAISAFERKEIVPDVIVCDLHLPGKSGVALLDQVRREQLKHVPFIMLTSDDDIENEIKVLALGADAYVTKNEDPRILSAHVERLLKQRAIQAA